MGSDKLLPELTPNVKELHPQNAPFEKATIENQGQRNLIACFGHT